MSRAEARTTATEDRTLVWDGCLNVRDLGGLPTTTGARTTRRAITRADNLDRLTAEGWDALLDHGVRTVVDLRNIEEYKPLLPSPATSNWSASRWTNSPAPPGGGPTATSTAPRSPCAPTWTTARTPPPS